MAVFDVEIGWIEWKIAEIDVETDGSNGVIHRCVPRQHFQEILNCYRKSVTQRTVPQNLSCAELEEHWDPERVWQVPVQGWKVMEDLQFGQWFSKIGFV